MTTRAGRRGRSSPSERHLVAAPEVGGPGPAGRRVVDAGHDHADAAHVGPGEARRAHRVGRGRGQRVEAHHRAALVRRPLRAGQHGARRVDDGEGRLGPPEVDGEHRPRPAGLGVVVSQCSSRGMLRRGRPESQRPAAAARDSAPQVSGPWTIDIDRLILKTISTEQACPLRGAFDEPQSTPRPRRRPSRHARTRRPRTGRARGRRPRRGRRDGRHGGRAPERPPRGAHDRGRAHAVARRDALGGRRLGHRRQPPPAVGDLARVPRARSTPTTAGRRP